MRHPSEGVLRRLVDEPAGVTDDERAHVAGCATCLRGLDEARADAQLVGSALAAPTTRDVDTDAAWARRDFFTGQVPGNSIAVQLNLGDGTLSAVVDYPAVDNSTDIAAGDIDGDNDVDLVAVADGTGLNNTSIDIYRNAGNGTVPSSMMSW